jgi:hypothetical protein
MCIFAYQIRETMRVADWDVEVETERGKGTTFAFVLRLAEG